MTVEGHLQAVGSALQRRWQEAGFIVCMYAGYVNNMGTNHDPIANSVPVDGSHTFWGHWLFLLTSNLCWELASDKIYRRWHENSTEAWMAARKCPHLLVFISKDPFWLQMVLLVKCSNEIVVVSVSFPRASKNSITAQQEVFSHRVISTVNGSIMEISFWIMYPPYLFI